MSLKTVSEQVKNLIYVAENSSVWGKFLNFGAINTGPAKMLAGHGHIRRII